MGEIKRLDESNYEEIFALSSFAFQYELTKEEAENKMEEIKDHAIFAWMEGDRLAGKLSVIPFTCYINNKPFKMGGIASVATWPEYRRQGVAKHLLQSGLDHMKESGQYLSFLHPFSIPFYRKYGFEVAFEQKVYKIPMDKLKQRWEAKGYIRSVDAYSDIALLDQMYTTFAREFNGTLKRDEKWWRLRILADKSLHVSVAYNEAHQAEGYIIFKVKDNVVTIKELVPTTLNGRKLLYEFVSNHDSMAKEVKVTVPENDQLSLIIEEPIFNQEVSPYTMARIVDVHGFLKTYPFETNKQQASVYVYVEDTVLPENNGTYQLKVKNNMVDISFTADKHDTAIQCSIQMMTSIFLGYKRPWELLDLGLIAGDRESVDVLDKLIPRKQTYFADFF